MDTDVNTTLDSQLPPIPNPLTIPAYPPFNLSLCVYVNIWSQGKWHYLTVVLDLSWAELWAWALPNKPDAEVVMKVLDMAYV